MQEKLSLTARSEQVAIALIAASKNKTLFMDDKAMQAINDLLRNASTELLGTSKSLPILNLLAVFISYL
jgi:hypothetical protein